MSAKGGYKYSTFKKRYQTNGRTLIGSYERKELCKINDSKEEKKPAFHCYCISYKCTFGLMYPSNKMQVKYVYKGELQNNICPDCKEKMITRERKRERLIFDVTKIKWHDK